MYGEPPYPRFGSFDKGYVLMINPCVVKGISIFLALAGRFPDIPFAALTGWGTTRQDREAMSRVPNITILETVPSIDDVLSQSRLLLMPSLWLEGFGLIAMEAMLRGLPVIASDSGGLKEAKAGTGFVIPVRPIERFEPVFDETHMPKPVDVPQDMNPWETALRSLLIDRAVYDEEAERSRKAAIGFVSQFDAGDFERYLLSLQPAAPIDEPARSTRTIVTPAKRALLLKRLRRARAQVGGMRIMLAHNSLYFPSHGGGDKSNRLLMEALAERGHEVRVVTRVENFGDADHDKLLARSGGARRRCRHNRSGGGTHRAERRGCPDADPQPADACVLLAADRRVRSRHHHHLDRRPRPTAFRSRHPCAPSARCLSRPRDNRCPFGPDSSMTSVAKTDNLRHADGVVGVSHYVANYVKQWSGIDAIHVPISLLERVFLSIRISAASTVRTSRWSTHAR